MHCVQCIVQYSSNIVCMQILLFMVFLARFYAIRQTNKKSYIYIILNIWQISTVFQSCEFIYFDFFFLLNLYFYTNYQG